MLGDVDGLSGVPGNETVDYPGNGVADASPSINPAQPRRAKRPQPESRSDPEADSKDSTGATGPRLLPKSNHRALAPPSHGRSLSIR